MCMTKVELDNKVSEMRSLKAMKEELENELKSIEVSIIEFFKENKVDEIIGNDYKATYKPQSKTTLDKVKLVEIFGSDLEPFEKVISYNVLRIK